MVGEYKICHEGMQKMAKGKQNMSAT